MHWDKRKYGAAAAANTSVIFRMLTCLCTYVCKHCENQSSKQWQFHSVGRRARVTSGVATCCCQQVGRAPRTRAKRERESEKESKNVTDCVIRTVNTRWEGESTHSDVAWSHAAILKYTQNRSKNNNSSSAGRAAALMTLTLRHCCFCFSVFAFLFAMPNWQESDTINDIKKNVN